MPLLHGTQVSPLPLPPQLTSLSNETEVWSIDQTGEVFLDYESYANRYLFYSQPIFRPNLTKPTTEDVTFFNALSLESDELDQLIQTEFPDPIKPRLIASILTTDTQSERTIDSLTSFLYRLHHNRFHINEKVIVDLSFNQPPITTSTVYYARIVKAFPPKTLRDFIKSLNLNDQSFIHLQLVDNLKLDLNDALKIDDPKSYLYTIQLIDENSNQNQNNEDFGGSFMEVDHRKLSRHPNSFSKALLKKFLQSALEPISRPSTSNSNSRWRVKQELVEKYELTHLQPPLPPSPPPPESIAKRPRRSKRVVAPITPEQSKKRKQDVSEAPIYNPPSFEDYLHPPLQAIDLVEWETNDVGLSVEPQDQPRKKKKKKKNKSKSLNQVEIKKLESNPPSLPPPTPIKESSLDEIQQHQITTSERTSSGKKTIKYPIEDLELDPLTIIDGRLLRRQGFTKPELPIKPIPSKPKESHEMFEKKLMIWLFINTFNITSYELDQVEDKIHFIVIKLLKLIPIQQNLINQEDEIKSFDEFNNEINYWVKKAGKFVKEFNLILEDKRNRQKQKGLNTNTTGEWLINLLEVINQRNGPSWLSKKLLEAEPGWEPDELEDIGDGTDEEDEKVYGRSIATRLNDVKFIKTTLRARFNSLTQTEKLDMLKFLCDIVAEGEHVRNAIEAAEECLTEIRKEKADLNKEKRRLNDELAKVEELIKAEKEENEKLPQTPSSSSAAPIYLKSAFNESITPSSNSIIETNLRKDLLNISQKDLHLNDKFRTTSGIIKLKPLGSDRFYSKYWWFDGIGGIKKTKGIFVSGPNLDEWLRVKELYDGLDSRKFKEEGEASLLPDEWGIYTTEEEIEGLIGWLNAKGTRESHLKQNLRDWKHVILLSVEAKDDE
ncbi:hypothetical protein CROQUDRAFT_90567, partial [Cronartium quercuum f. sp. fusiforme G11]